MCPADSMCESEVSVGICFVDNSLCVQHCVVDTCLCVDVCFKGILRSLNEINLYTRDF